FAVFNPTLLPLHWTGLFCLNVFLLPLISEICSLYYTYSATLKPLISEDIYEFHSSVELSDIEMNFCNSSNKAKFLTKLCEESKRLFKSESDELRYKREWLQINLSSLRHMRNQNRTNDTDLHILQWRHGCAAECHSNGSVIFLQGTDEYAYNGDNLTFNLSMHWKPLVLEHGIIWNRESVSRLERKCVETLTSLSELQREGKFIKKGEFVLVCLATGFYPKHVQVEIRRDQTLLPDEQLNSSGIRPNADGSFQLKKSLKILPSERSRYQCVVTEWILPITSMAYRGDDICLNVQKTPKTPSQVKLLSESDTSKSYLLKHNTYVHMSLKGIFDSTKA
uniref:Immunoglobulin C1-set domain-containing protein n=1 Tax=Cyprinus carpio TaxID=7962 RepID=A0A8C1Z102_CYPCA